MTTGFDGTYFSNICRNLRGQSRPLAFTRPYLSLNLSYWCVATTVPFADPALIAVDQLLRCLEGLLPNSLKS